MHCPACGKENDDDAQFCVHCRHNLVQLSTPPAVSHFYTRLSSVLGSLTLFFIVFMLLATNIDFFQLPAIAFTITFIVSLGISYFFTRYFMMKYPYLNIPVILIFTFYMLYSIFFNNGIVAPRLTFGTNPVMAIIIVLFVIGLFYYLTGWLFENHEEPLNEN